MAFEPLYSGLYPFKREVHMAVVLHVRRHTHNVHAIFVKPFCSALCHKVIRIVAEQTYHCAVCTLWVFIICTIKTVFLIAKKLFLHNTDLSKLVFFIKLDLTNHISKKQGRLLRPKLYYITFLLICQVY